MGACASVPKAMRDEEAAVAPPPEQPKEETAAAEAVVQEESGDNKKEERAVEENDESQSLETLLVEGEAPIEEIEEIKAEEVLPVSEPAAEAEEKSADAAAVVAAA